VGDGFYFTGDIGALDEEGRVLLHRRVAGATDAAGRRLPSDLIIQVLGSHPAVESVRIEVHSTTFRRGRVYVSTCDAVDQSELRSYCRRYLTPAEMRFDLQCQTPPD
jgi:acyl-coenzyme A synthetase/AMP-(fatty) acid ligase